MDLFTLLKDDHKVVLSQLQECIQSKTVEREQLKKLGNTLMLHFKMEEEFLYPQLQKHNEGKALAKECFSDHQEAKEIIKDLLQSEWETSALQKQVLSLQEVLQDHIRTEENVVFPLVQKIFTKDNITQMGNQMISLKERSRHEQFV